MDAQRWRIEGRTYAADDPTLQEALARVYNTVHRPRCLCAGGGLEMYVARHGHYVVKRMPGSGPAHHPSCPSYEAELAWSGLGELLGESIIEHSPEAVELRLDFPLTRIAGRSRRSDVEHDPASVEVPRQRMSLRALMHFLFERAGFNRWTPAMEGKRNQAVLHHYLLEAAEGIRANGVALSERLYVPEPFDEARKREIAERRRRKLALLRAADSDTRFGMALVLGEYKGAEATPSGRKVWVKHMPDAPLFIEAKAWARIERVYGSLLEARDADTRAKPRLVIGALIHARREHTYQIDRATLMLATANWIPIEGLHEADLIAALTEQKRRFLKPLRYDARRAAPFPNVLLLDTGVQPTPLHVVSALMDARERAAKEAALKAQGGTAWVWYTDQPMPALP